MTVQIGQLTYSLYPPQADPGMLADNEVNHILSFPAAEAINPGVCVEVAADGVSVQQPQQTGSTFSPVGISILLTAREGLGASNTTTQNGGNGNGGVYAAGDMVPVLRRGAIFAYWKGTTQTGYASPNVYHSSTIATDRGKLTDAATSSSAGVEIAAAPVTIQLRQALTGSGNIALVEVNMPGHS